MDGGRAGRVSRRSPEDGHGTRRLGAGIGLFVVRNLVQAMGGRAWPEPAAGAGSCFVAALRRVSVEAV